jgi:hypothetical protein
VVWSLVMQCKGALGSGGGELPLSKWNGVITTSSDLTYAMKVMVMVISGEVDDALDIPSKRGRRRDSRRCSIATSAPFAPGPRFSIRRAHIAIIR